MVTEADSHMDSEPSSSVAQQEEVGSCDSVGVVMHLSCDPVTHSQNLEKYPASSDEAGEVKPDSKAYGGGMPPSNGSERVFIGRGANQEAGLAHSVSTANSREQLALIGAFRGGVVLGPDSDCCSGRVLEDGGIVDGQSFDSVAGVHSQVGSGEGRPPSTDTVSEPRDTERESRKDSHDLKEEKLEMASQERLHEAELHEVESHNKMEVKSNDQGKEMEVESRDKETEMEVESRDKETEMEIDSNKELEMELCDAKKEKGVESHGREEEEKASQSQESQIKSREGKVETKVDFESCDNVTGLSVEAPGNNDIQSSNKDVVESSLRLPGEQEGDEKEVCKGEEVQSSLNDKRVEPSLEVTENKQAVESNDREVRSRGKESGSNEVTLEKAHDKVEGTNGSESISKEVPVFPHTALWSQPESGDKSHDPQPMDEVEGGKEMTSHDGKVKSRDLAAGKEVESVEVLCDTDAGTEGHLCGDKEVNSLLSHDKKQDKTVQSHGKDECHNKDLSRDVESCNKGCDNEFHDNKKDKTIEFHDKKHGNEHEEQAQSHDKEQGTQNEQEPDKDIESRPEGYKQVALGMEGEMQYPDQLAPHEQMESHDNEMQSNEGPQNIPPTESGNKEMESHEDNNRSIECSHGMEDTSHDQQLVPPFESHDLSVVTKQVSHDTDGQMEGLSRGESIHGAQQEPSFDTEFPNSSESNDGEICLPESHDPLPGSHDPVMTESRDPMAIDPPPESHDPVLTVSHESPPESHDRIITSPEGLPGVVSITSADRGTESHGDHVASAEPAHEVNETSMETAETVGEVHEGLGDGINGDGETPARLPPSVSQTQLAMTSSHESWSVVEDARERKSAILSQSSSLPSTEAPPDGGGLQVTTEQAKVFVREAISEVAFPQKPVGSCDESPDHEERSHDQSVMSGENPDEQPTLKEAKAHDWPSVNEEELHNQPTVADAESHDQPTMTGVESTLESHDEPMLTVVESHDRQTLADVESHDMVSVNDARSHDESAVSELRSHDQLAEKDETSHDKPAENDAMSQDPANDAESHTVYDQSGQEKAKLQDPLTTKDLCEKSHDIRNEAERESRDTKQELRESESNAEFDTEVRNKNEGSSRGAAHPNQPSDKKDSTSVDEATEYSILVGQSLVAASSTTEDRPRNIGDQPALDPQSQHLSYSKSCDSEMKSLDCEPKSHDSIQKSQETGQRSSEYKVKSDAISHHDSSSETKTAPESHLSKEKCINGSKVTSETQLYAPIDDKDEVDRDKEGEVKSTASDSTSCEENEGISCEAEAKQEVGVADGPQESPEDMEFVAASNRVVSLATELLEKWEGLKEVFRIPKRTQSVR